jgi:hypothetical protein
MCAQVNPQWIDMSGHRSDGLPCSANLPPGLSKPALLPCPYVTAVTQFPIPEIEE